MKRGYDAFERLAAVPYPTLALVRGFCLGGGLELALACRYRIVDPVRLHREVSDCQAQLYVTLQLALREVVGRLRFDELLERKDDLAALMLTQLPKGDAVKFVAAGLKDVILPGEIRDIMNTVLIAEKKAQANVIARREEVESRKRSR